MWHAIYAEKKFSTISSYTEKEMFFYLFLTGVLSFIFTFEPVFRLANQVKSGRLTTLMLRPINIRLESLSYYVGSKIVFITIIIVVICLFTNPLNYLSWIVYLIVSLILWHELMFVIGTFSFWLIQMWPLRPIINAIYLFFGGLLFPLTVLPSALYNIFKFLPFSLVSSDFIEVINSTTNTNHSFVQYLIASILWLLFLNVVSKKLFSSGIKKFEGVGI